MIWIVNNAETCLDGIQDGHKRAFAVGMTRGCRDAYFTCSASSIFKEPASVTLTATDGIE
jgi:hypothetical protein